MQSSEDKQWASKYLLDPLNAPEPSEETGPGTHFSSTYAPGRSGASSSSYENEGKTKATVNVQQLRSPKNKYPPSAQSASPRRSQFSGHRQDSFDGFSQAGPVRSVSMRSNRTSSEIPTSTAPSARSSTSYNNDGTRRRGSSLNERFPGDPSVRPLDRIRHETIAANRSRHLRRAQHSGQDSIDNLDTSFLGGYHHDGPFEAASLARNRDLRSAPLAAIAGTNAEALKATPREMVIDSIRRHRPLHGVAYIPPGVEAPDGSKFYYEEGTDMNRFNGADYKRWPGIDYHPDDLKGKGEPSYSIEKALKDHKRAGDHRRVFSEGGIEMSSRPHRSSSLHVAGSGNEPRYSQWEGDLRRSDSAPKPGFVQRLGSLRRRKGHSELSQKED